MALLHFPVDDSGVDVQEEAALWAGGNNQLLIIRYYITIIFIQRALGLLLADGAPTVGGGKTF